MVVLATDFAITVTRRSHRAARHDAAGPEPLFDVPIGAAVAVFLALAAPRPPAHRDAAAAHLRERPGGGINRFRWVEYSVSATIMVLLIAIYTGIAGITALIGIAGANVAMILFGWLQEPPTRRAARRTTMRPFWFGCVAGVAPWIAIGYNLVARRGVPGFVIGIFVSLFLFFNSFALNQWLQYRRVGPWRSYAFGEKAYLVLSLVAKSALAWQIFAGSLAS